MTMIVFGYKPNGRARLFELEEGAKLPFGWSEDISIIEDLSNRSGEAISAAAGGAGAVPVPVFLTATAAGPGAAPVPVPVPLAALAARPRLALTGAERAAHMRKVAAERRAANEQKSEN